MLGRADALPPWWEGVSPTAWVLCDHITSLDNALEVQEASAYLPTQTLFAAFGSTLDAAGTR